jgi:hypothetical protein
MARWKLVAPHYLKVPGTTWEYKENSRTTGKPVRRVFDVPLLVDPREPSDWTQILGRDDGIVVVCFEGKGEAGDITFEGDPTPDMVPMDDEAKAISAKFAGQWKHPIETLNSTYSQVLVDNFQTEIVKLQAETNKPAAVEGMTELLTAMTVMMKQNQELISILTQKSVPSKPVELRR